MIRSGRDDKIAEVAASHRKSAQEKFFQEIP